MHLPDSIQLPLLGPVSEIRLILQDLATTLKRVKRSDLLKETNGESLAPLGKLLVDTARQAHKDLFFDVEEPATDLSLPNIPTFHDKPKSTLHINTSAPQGPCIRTEGAIGPTKHVSWDTNIPQSPNFSTASSRERYPGRNISNPPPPPPPFPLPLHLRLMILSANRLGPGARLVVSVRQPTLTTPLAAQPLLTRYLCPTRNNINKNQQQPMCHLRGCHQWPYLSLLHQPFCCNPLARFIN